MILVTGAGGNVGSELVRRLSTSGAKFRAGYNSRGKLEAAKRAGQDAVAIDYTRPATVASALAGVDHLFLLGAGAAAAGQTEAEIGVVRAAKEAGVRHVVKLSVWAADGEAFSFAKVHRPVERALESSGMGWTFLRPNGFMQNLSNFFAATIKEQGAFHLPSRGCRISHVDVRDIAAVAAKTLTEPGHEGRAYLLSGPEALTYAEIAAKLSAVTGRPVAYVDIPDADFKKGAMASGMPEAYADAMLSLIHFYETGGAARVTGDVEKVTGRKPITFDQFARDHAGAFK
jgi:uncharacterized protein YbjT (DUF2867 family)